MNEGSNTDLMCNTSYGGLVPPRQTSFILVHSAQIVGIVVLLTKTLSAATKGRQQMMISLARCRAHLCKVPGGYECRWTPLVPLRRARRQVSWRHMQLQRIGMGGAVLAVDSMSLKRGCLGSSACLAICSHLFEEPVLLMQASSEQHGDPAVRNTCSL